MTAELEPFHAISIAHLAYALQSEGRTVIHMEIGQPSTGAPSKAIAAAHRALDGGPMGYWESTALQRRLAQHYAGTYGVDVDPSCFVLTCGASQALVLALMSNFAPGDRVALARPGYVAYRNTLKALNLEPVEIPCGADVRFQLTAASFEALDPPPAGVIVASPANPTGTIIAADELRAIANVCRARAIKIVSDEIYHGISYVGPAHSMLEFEPQAFVVNSFSKYFSMPGWRLGWLLVPRDAIRRTRTFSGNLFLSTPVPSQHAALAAFDCKDELEGYVAVYARNRERLLEALPRLRLRGIAPPDGAFYIYADIGHLTNDSLQFCKTLLQDTGVATAPGIDFDPVEGRRFMRMSFAVSSPEIETAIDKMEAWISRL